MDCEIVSIANMFIGLAIGVAACLVFEFVLRIFE